MPYKNKADLYEAQKRHRVKIRQRIYEYLVGKKCVDCPESDPVVLEFDHAEPSKKFKTINKMLSGHYGWETVEKEIEKCTIRCANCHRRKTYGQLHSLGIKMPL